MEGLKAYHPSHPEHELVSRTIDKPFHCDGCKEIGLGRRYRCESSNCDYVLHPICMYNSQTATHRFYSDCTFKFSSKQRCTSTWCDACGKTVKGFNYNCGDKNLDLNPGCLNLKDEITLSISNCDVNLELNGKLTSECYWCESKTVIFGTYKQIDGRWSYKSKCNKYHFHVHCVTEVFHETWKKRDYKYESTASISSSPQRRISSGGKYWKILKVVLTTVVAILTGDPTVILSSSLVNLIITGVSSVLQKEKMLKN